MALAPSKQGDDVDNLVAVKMFSRRVENMPNVRVAVLDYPVGKLETLVWPKGPYQVVRHLIAVAQVARYRVVLRVRRVENRLLVLDYDGEAPGWKLLDVLRETDKNGFVPAPKWHCSLYSERAVVVPKLDMDGNNLEPVKAAPANFLAGKVSSNEFFSFV